MKKKNFKKPATLDSLSNLIETLASATSRGFARVEERFNKVEKNITEVNENLKSTRQSILEVGDRFVPRYEFDSLLMRLSRLEKKLHEKLR